MISRARFAFFSAMPLMSIVGQVGGFAAGLFCLNYRLEKNEKIKLEKENPGCEIVQVRDKGHYKAYGRYSCHKWSVIKPDKPLEKPKVEAKAATIHSAPQISVTEIISRKP